MSLFSPGVITCQAFLFWGGNDTLKRLTDTQKTGIRNLRAAGLGYKTIADRLSLSRETVRSFCVRNDIPGEKATDNGDPLSGADNAAEIRCGGTVFIITTGYSESATGTLKEKLEKLILDDALRQSKSYQFVQAS
jgi:hypothetical protein